MKQQVVANSFCCEVQSKEGLRLSTFPPLAQAKKDRVFVATHRPCHFCSCGLSISYMSCKIQDDRKKKSRNPKKNVHSPRQSRSKIRAKRSNKRQINSWIDFSAPTGKNEAQIDFFIGFDRACILRALSQYQHHRGKELRRQKRRAKSQD